MKIYTQEEFNNLPIVDGRKQCPTGDYTQIKSFGDGCSFGEWCSFGGCCSFGEWCSFGECCSFGGCCSFGEWCSFGDGCSFGEWCSFEDGNEAKDGYPILSFGGFGSCNRTTYFFNTVKGIIVRCGCFKGTISEFREKVMETHGDTKSAKEYLVIADLVEMKWQ